MQVQYFNSNPIFILVTLRFLLQAIRRVAE